MEENLEHMNRLFLSGARVDASERPADRRCREGVDPSPRTIGNARIAFLALIAASSLSADLVMV